MGVTAEEFERSDTKRRLDPDDRSITVHVCHSAQREVEVLHDQLLAMLQDDPDLTPRDIVVMVADIDSYSPFIQAVFGSATGERYLPYAISDRRARQSHPPCRHSLPCCHCPTAASFPKMSWHCSMSPCWPLVLTLTKRGCATFVSG
ncbi:exodeoxyribonuclease V subunit gamma [Enterobacter cloacae]|uniref:Exodeoxyribonuclease V subunit gamma n=1 Tax=Enterobacter cloacae TaxID=550 RepID=A0A377LT59_ENTCL|nr:exodeoxyribonuclease V subunit gamma [Enterobacter cloacae]